MEIEVAVVRDFFIELNVEERLLSPFYVQREQESDIQSPQSNDVNMVETGHENEAVHETPMVSTLQDGQGLQSEKTPSEVLLERLAQCDITITNGDQDAGTSRPATNRYLHNEFNRLQFGVDYGKSQDLRSRLVIFVGNPFIPHMLVLTIRERRTIEDMEKDMISDWLSPSTKKYPFDDWSNSSYQQDTYSSMRNQPSRDIIRFLLETEQDMNLTEQELDQWIEQRDQEAEEEIKSILQKISAETMSAIPLESVEVNEVTPIEDYWSEPEEIIEVSLHEPDISIAQNEADEAEKEIDVILERLEEPQKRSKEDQPLVLVKPPTLPCIFVRPYKGVVIKERSQIFYTVDTFVSADDDAIDSYVLEVPDELLNLNEGMSDELPKAIDAPFVVDISKGEGIT
ncbi:hypothetical protein Sjap_010291 [Stephania japonica]|uniref:Uncharacterized protein n=1 Tax=Stephania japonica TaxID=461633 RepID=A0AAP0P4G9_9MAGN